MSESAPQDRYHFKPFFGSSHYWALQELQLFSPSSRLLDIGAGPGALGKVLRERGWQDLTAVEIDPRAHELLRTTYAAVHHTLDQVAAKEFDLVLLLDVLEHIPQCEQFLSAVIERLAPGGAALISVPNFAHWSVRLMLLFGQLPQMERGILDKTHVQCFTRQRFVAMLQNAGLEIQQLSASIVPLELLLPASLSSNRLFELAARARHQIAQVLPGLCAFQHLALLRKRKG